MSNLAVARDDHFTWDLYRTWPDDERWELIGGVAYNMTPAPRTRHQSISGSLSSELLQHFDGRECRVFPAPTDVKLSEEDVVQPDLLVVCDRDKIKPTHVEGAPTLVVEILSPSTEVKDRGAKMDLYARSGVSEVWIVTPYPSLIEVYSLTEQGYRLVKAYSKEETLHSEAFKDLEITLEPIFNFPLEPGEEIRVVRESPAAYGAEPVPHVQ
jgi:Uma2 family endonuclease